MRDLREFKWICFGIGALCTGLFIWMLIFARGPAKCLSLFIFAAAIVFFWGFNMMRQKIKSIQKPPPSDSNNDFLKLQLEAYERTRARQEECENYNRQWFHETYIKKTQKRPPN